MSVSELGSKHARPCIAEATPCRLGAASALASAFIEALLKRLNNGEKITIQDIEKELGPHMAAK